MGRGEQEASSVTGPVTATHMAGRKKINGSWAVFLHYFFQIIQLFAQSDDFVTE